MRCVQRRACPRPLHLNLSPRPDSANQLLRILSRAERFVYSSSHERWIAKSIHRPPSLFRMPAINWRHDQLIDGFYRERVCERCGVPFTKSELDSADITFRGEKTADGVMLEEVKAVPHVCQR